MESCKGPARVAVLTAGRDKPYALGLADALIARNTLFEFLGSTVVDSPTLHEHPLVKFRMCRDQREGAGKAAKVRRVAAYYLRLLGYAVTAKPRIFHILWNNYFEWFDRTVLTIVYRLCGRKLVYTAHNVNRGKRDGDDSWWNRLTLSVQYRLVHHIFVHTERMREELRHDFGIPDKKITVIPFGMNSTVPDTAMDGAVARARLGLGPAHKILLFFGNIAPYKGLEDLVTAFLALAGEDPELRLVIAGRPKGSESYWEEIQERIEASAFASRVVRRIEYVPDEETEVYFKAADALVLPYKHIFQSGVLFLGYNFGLPVIATDVGSLREDIREGETGFICQPNDPNSLKQALGRYFTSALYGGLSERRDSIRSYAAHRYSWERVGELTTQIYDRLAG